MSEWQFQSPTLFLSLLERDDSWCSSDNFNRGPISQPKTGLNINTTFEFPQIFQPGLND
jgi:hypothetical protein